MTRLIDTQTAITEDTCTLRELDQLRLQPNVTRIPQIFKMLNLHN